MNKKSIPYVFNEKKSLVHMLEQRSFEDWLSLEDFLRIRQRFLGPVMLSYTFGIAFALWLILVFLVFWLNEFNLNLLAYMTGVFIFPIADIPRRWAETHDMYASFIKEPRHAGADAQKLENLKFLLKAIGFRYRLCNLSKITIGKVCQHIDKIMLKAGYHTKKFQDQGKPEKAKPYKNKMERVQFAAYELAECTGEIWIKTWDNYIPGSKLEAASDGETRASAVTA